MSMLLLVLVALLTPLFLFMLWYLRNRSRLKLLYELPRDFHSIGWVISLYSKNLEHHTGVYILQRIQGYNLLFPKEGFHVFWMGYEAVISVYHPEIVELILSSNTSLEKSFEYSFLHQWLGRGLLTSTGAKWRTRRKLLTPTLHFRILEDFMPTFNEQSLILVKKLHSLVDEDYVAIEPLVVLCTLDIVCETVMGTYIGAQKGKNSEYVNAIHNLGDFFQKRMVKPWMWSDFLYGLTSEGRSFGRDIKILHNFTDKVIKKKKSKLTSHQTSDDTKDGELPKKKRQALMDLLLDLHIKGQQLTEEGIREEVDTFMFEGHDTTAMGINFALYNIGLYPEVQRKIHEELDAILENDPQRPISMDDARSMKYLECVLKESQRHFPSVPLIGRKLNEDIKYKEWVFPKGTTLHCNIVNLHMRKDVFPVPEIFDPDRFQPERVLHRHPYAYIPFSAGPRNCIGQKFALLEEKVIVGNILRNFRIISIDPRDRFHVKVEFTLRPAQPVRLKFVPR